MNKSPNLAAKIRRSEALRDAIQKKQGFRGDDQLQTARNLYKILSIARKNKSFDLNEVLEESGLKGSLKTDSTKRLYTYTLPPNAGEDRIKHIARKPAKYLKIACAIAKHLDEPEAVILSQVFEGCSFGTEYAEDSDWDNENWARLVMLIAEMAKAIIKDKNLDEYWRKVRATNGRYDVRENIFHSSSYAIKSYTEGWGLAGAYVHHQEMAPVPSILIGSCRQSDPVSGKISLICGEVVEVYFKYWLEVRLALGPVNDQKNIGPLLEFRTVLVAETHDNIHISFDNPFTDGGDIVKIANFEGKLRAIDKIDIFDPAIIPTAEYRRDGDHSYFGWEELNPALLCRLLEPQEKEFITYDHNSMMLPESLPPNRFARGSPAGILHANLLTGKLDQELSGVCENFKTCLDALRAGNASEIRNAESQAIAGWSARITSSQA